MCGRVARPRQRAAECGREVRPAGEDRRLAPAGPALRDRLARQVNDRVETIEERQVRRGQVRVDRLRIGRWGRVSQEPDDLVPLGAQHRLQVAADQPRRAGEQDSHGRRLRGRRAKSKAF